MPLRACMLEDISKAYSDIFQVALTVKLLNNRFLCVAKLKSTVSVKVVLEFYET